MPERLNVYIPDDLHRALQAHRERLNVSRICQEALAREVAAVESLLQVDGPLPQLREEERIGIAARLRAERERRESYWYDIAYRTAFDWACHHADPEALQAVALGLALDAAPMPGWVAGKQFAPPPQAAAARAWQGLHDLAVDAAKRRTDAPPQDVRAFNRGVRDGSKAVWDAVAHEVAGEPEQGPGPEHVAGIVEFRVDEGGSGGPEAKRRTLPEGPGPLG